jgi:hypothetical protein
MTAVATARKTEAKNARRGIVRVRVTVILRGSGENLAELDWELGGGIAAKGLKERKKEE